MDGFVTDIVSRETIRPSSPTPSDLRVYNLSLLEQLAPIVYTPCTLFYSVNDTTFDRNKAVDQLKDSLSQTLSIFYPLAGRIRDHLSVDCNDEGVEFSVATVRLNLEEYLKNPNLDFLHQFLPTVENIISPENLSSAVQVAVQVNIFSSGGLAVGMRFLHRIVDANAMAMFLNVWAGIASTRSEIKPGDFNASSVHFPPLEETPGKDMMFFDTNWLRKKEKSLISRVVFDGEAITALKARAAEGNRLPNPSRFEVVSSFIWKHASAASTTSLGGGGGGSAVDVQQQPPSMMMVAVDLGTKTMPPAEKYSIGNRVWLALAHQSHRIEESEIGSIGYELRRAVKEMTTNFLGDDGPSMALKRQVKEAKDRYCDDTLNVYVCSSWCGFPFYEVDFGWGKPVWVVHTSQVSATPAYINTMILIDSNSGGGVEAWLLLGENHTAKLFSDPEFLRYASVNPSISVKKEI